MTCKQRIRKLHYVPTVPTSRRVLTDLRAFPTTSEVRAQLRCTLVTDSDNSTNQHHNTQTLSNHSIHRSHLVAGKATLHCPLPGEETNPLRPLHRLKFFEFWDPAMGLNRCAAWMCPNTRANSPNLRFHRIPKDR